MFSIKVNLILFRKAHFTSLWKRVVALNQEVVEPKIAGKEPNSFKPNFILYKMRISQADQKQQIEPLLGMAQVVTLLKERIFHQNKLTRSQGDKIMFYLECVVLASRSYKLTFSQAVEKIFAGVNRHQGTLKVQGP